MTKPTVHLNGTGRESLRRDFEAAQRALMGALHALATMSPNARDYYPQGPGAFDRADDEHQDRMARVRGVLEEVQELDLSLDGVQP
jgi:hypothetical protein